MRAKRRKFSRMPCSRWTSCWSRSIALQGAAVARGLRVVEVLGEELEVQLEGR